MAYTMRIPQIKDVENALRIYYDRLELSNKDIRELFAWGIDPEDLEARLTKLRRMKLTSDRQVDSNA